MYVLLLGWFVTRASDTMQFRQQDAHELLRHLLDAMYMDEMDVSHFQCVNGPQS